MKNLHDEIPVFCIAAALVAGGFSAGVLFGTISLRGPILALKDDLNAGIAALKAQAAANKTSADAAIARVQATISALQAGQNDGSVDDATVTQAIADLNSVVGTLQGVGAELDAEDPAAPATT